MIEIVSDSSTLFDKQEARKQGFTMVPLHVIVDGKSYKDYEDIDLDTFLDYCAQGKTVSSSQPSIGEKIDVYNQLLADPDTKILDITMADGLSGTYQSALIAKEQCDDPARVSVLNSKTLCGPQRSLVLKAIDMRDNGKDLEEIVETLINDRESDVSTISVEDFGFLERGGRVNKVVSKAGDLLKLIPFAVKTEDGTSLKMSGFSRTYKKVFSQVQKEFDKAGVGDGYTIYITHAKNEPVAMKAKEHFEGVYPGAEVKVLPLCPMFATHGGPGCVAFQAIKTPKIS